MIDENGLAPLHYPPMPHRERLSAHHIESLVTAAWETAQRDPAEGQRMALAALQAAEEAGDNTARAVCRLNVAWTRIFLADYERARSDLELAIQIAEADAHEPELLAKLYNALGAALYRSGAIAEAITRFTTSYTIADEHRLPLRQVAALNNLGEVELSVGQVETARELFARAAQVLDSGSPDDEMMVVVHANLGDVARRAGRLEESDELLSGALETARRIGDRVNEGEIRARLGALAVARGERGEAENHYTESIRIANAIGSPVLRCQALMQLADLHRDLGQPEMGMQLYQQAQEIANTTGARHLSYRLYRRVADTYEELGDATAALASFKAYADLREQLLEEATSHRLTELARRIETDRLQAVSDIAQEITANLDLDDMLDGMYQRVNRILDARVFSIALYDESSHTLDYRLIMEQGKRVAPQRVDCTQPTSFGAWVIRNRSIVVIEDMAAEYGTYLSERPSSLDRIGNHSAIYVPLIVADRLIGVISTQSPRPRAYSDLDIRLVQTFAAFVAIAIDNALIMSQVTVLNRIVRQEKDELQRAYEQISELANQDSLTGVANRRMFEEMCAARISTVGQRGGSVGLLFIDLDRFKPINDTWGHAAGDEVLRTIADRLRQSVRGDDVVARLGGDEFVVLLATPGSSQDMERLATKIASTVAEPIVVSDHVNTDAEGPATLTVSASTGLARYPIDGTTLPELIRSADTRMYGAKAQRR